MFVRPTLTSMAYDYQNMFASLNLLMHHFVDVPTCYALWDSTLGAWGPFPRTFFVSLRYTSMDSSGHALYGRCTCSRLPSKLRRVVSKGPTASYVPPAVYSTSCLMDRWRGDISASTMMRYLALQQQLRPKFRVPFTAHLA